MDSKKLKDLYDTYLRARLSVKGGTSPMVGPGTQSEALFASALAYENSFYTIDQFERELSNLTER